MRSASELRFKLKMQQFTVGAELQVPSERILVWKDSAEALVANNGIFKLAMPFCHRPTTVIKLNCNLRSVKVRHVAHRRNPQLPDKQLAKAVVSYRGLCLEIIGWHTVHLLR